MDARGFFVGARGMCWLLGMSTGRSGTPAVASCWSQLLVLGGATVARSLLRCSEGSCLSSVGGPCLVGLHEQSFPLCECILSLLSKLSGRQRLHQGLSRAMRVPPLRRLS
ncbi:hypothetical protein GW17_00019030 [Ensete ventricosum]|nr:hypothetical protein GW17_00019030 [Ensete ventricosum]RZS12517.1 hypothetical protein BHM03_00043974 [Ensete ventricosum]